MCNGGLVGSSRLEIRRDGRRLTAIDVGHARPRDADDATQEWFLTAAQRGNRATRLLPWSTQNSATPLVHGRPYFAALADAVDALCPGDLLLMVGWRVDPDELVRDEQERKRQSVPVSCPCQSEANRTGPEQSKRKRVKANQPKTNQTRANQI